jgi:hypothetical protein
MWMNCMQKLYNRSTTVRQLFYNCSTTVLQPFCQPPLPALVSPRTAAAAAASAAL